MYVPSVESHCAETLKRRFGRAHHPTDGCWRLARAALPPSIISTPRPTKHQAQALPAPPGPWDRGPCPLCSGHAQPALCHPRGPLSQGRWHLLSAPVPRPIACRPVPLPLTVRLWRTLAPAAAPSVGTGQEPSVPAPASLLPLEPELWTPVATGPVSLPR